MKKLLLRLVLIAVLLLLLAVGAAFVFLDPIVKTAIAKGTAYATGVPVMLDDADVRPTGGALEFGRLHVANPEGFTTPHFLVLGRAYAKWDNGTVFSDRLQMRELTVDGLDVNLEKGANGSNWKKILDHLEQLSAGKASSEPPPGEPPPADASSKRSLHIDRIELRNVKISLTLHDVPLVAGTKTLELPPIVIENYQSDGSTLDLVAKLTRTVISAVLTQATTSGADWLPKDVLGDLRGGLDGLKKKLGEEAGKLLENLDVKDLDKSLEGVKDIFKKKK